MRTSPPGADRGGALRRFPEPASGRGIRDRRRRRLLPRPGAAHVPGAAPGRVQAAAWRSAADPRQAAARPAGDQAGETPGRRMARRITLGPALPAARARSASGRSLTRRHRSCAAPIFGGDFPLRLIFRDVEVTSSGGEPAAPIPLREYDLRPGRTAMPISLVQGPPAEAGSSRWRRWLEIPEPIQTARGRVSADPPKSHVRGGGFRHAPTGRLRSRSTGIASVRISPWKKPHANPPRIHPFAELLEGPRPARPPRHPLSLAAGRDLFRREPRVGLPRAQSRRLHAGADAGRRPRDRGVECDPLLSGGGHALHAGRQFTRGALRARQGDAVAVLRAVLRRSR